MQLKDSIKTNRLSRLVEHWFLKFWIKENHIPEYPWGRLIVVPSSFLPLKYASSSAKPSTSIPTPRLRNSISKQKRTRSSQQWRGIKRRNYQWAWVWNSARRRQDQWIWRNKEAGERDLWDPQHRLASDLWLLLLRFPSPSLTRVRCCSSINPYAYCDCETWSVLWNGINLSCISMMKKLAVITAKIGLTREIDPARPYFGYVWVFKITFDINGFGSFTRELVYFIYNYIFI